jgi:serine/threonine protein kinase
MMVRPPSVEFLVHMSLAAGVTAISGLEEDELGERARPEGGVPTREAIAGTAPVTSMSEHIPNRVNHLPLIRHDFKVRPVPTEGHSVTGARLDLQWRQLANVEYLTDGGNSWIHTAVFDGKPVVVKTLKPECQDVALAINEIEGELLVHARLNHSNIVSLLGAGTTSKGVRFVVLERLDGGTLTQRLGYDTRIRDRRRRFWRKKQFSYLDVLRIARSIAEAMAYCNEEAIPNCVVMHRDLKPDVSSSRNVNCAYDLAVRLMNFVLPRLSSS